MNEKIKESIKMNVKGVRKWEHEFLKACEEGNVEAIKTLTKPSPQMKKEWMNVRVKNDYGLQLACQKGHLEVVRYLLTSKELLEGGHDFPDLHSGDQYGNEYPLKLACKHGHVEVVKYLLTSKELLEAGHTFADLHDDNDWALCLAVSQGHVNVVKFLTTSNELVEAGHEWADLHTQNEMPFRVACQSERLEVVRYLMENEEIKNKQGLIDVHANDADAFEILLSFQYESILKYLVLEQNINKTPRIEELLKIYPQEVCFFKIKEEEVELQKTLRDQSLQNQLQSSPRNPLNQFVEPIKDLHQESQKPQKKTKKL